MAENSRFATGVHILLLLAAAPESLVTSGELAESLATHPVVVRRVQSALHRAGLILSQKGPNGGSKLARSPKAILLGDVYRAVQTDPLFTSSGRGKASSFDAVLNRSFADAQKALEEEFDQISLAQLSKKLAKKSKR